MNHINFLNENILFSTKKGRIESIDSIASVDKCINYFTNMGEKINKVIYNACNTFFNGDIVKNVTNNFSKLERVNKNIDEIYNKFKDIPDEINIFKKDIFREMEKRKKFINKADFKKDEVISKYQELAKKCAPDGEYYKKLDELRTSFSEIEERMDLDIKTKIMQSTIEFGPDTKEYKALRNFINEHNAWNKIVMSLFSIIKTIK